MSYQLSFLQSTSRLGQVRTLTSKKHSNLRDLEQILQKRSEKGETEIRLPEYESAEECYDI